MDQPDAQNVGREFVRQYYTMLHEAPGFLHRFYSHNSSFVHGGVEKPGEEQPPSVGQAEIHKKIESLEFRDCHAKIRQVDSQASVGGSVVIQVAGELSNNGSLMRRFMQTFVLAPQSLKKYYLHNDIFRYQDEVFLDPPATPEPDVAPAGLVGGATLGEENYQRELADAEVAQQQQLQQQLLVQQQLLAQQQQEAMAREACSPVIVGTAYEENAEQAAMSNGEVLSDHVVLEGPTGPELPEPAALSPARPVDQPAPGPVSAELEEPTVVVAAAVERTEGVEGVGGEGKEKAPEAEPQPVVPAAKPTWAAMASRNTAPVSNPPAAGYAPKPQATIRPEPKPEARGGGSAINGGAPLPQRAPRPQAPQQPAAQSQPAAESTSAPATDLDALPGGPSRPNLGGGGWTEAVGRGGGGGADQGEDGARLRGPPPVIYPDNQQVFVGNVPHAVSDVELKEYFEQYGPVADIRINRKGQNLPNFGFVSFESVEGVQSILSSMPLPKLHGKYRLNVESKKPKEELAASRPRSGPPTRGGGRGGGGPGAPDDYQSPSGGRGGGPGGRGGASHYNGTRGAYNGGGGGYGGGGRGYAKSGLDEGRPGASALAGQQH